jgi:hypothetical protein
MSTFSLISIPGYGTKNTAKMQTTRRNSERWKRLVVVLDLHAMDKFQAKALVLDVKPILEFHHNINPMQVGANETTLM